MSSARARPARTGVCDPQDTWTLSLSLSEGVIIVINDDVSAFDPAEKTDKVTTNMASDGASSIGCNRREANVAEAAR